MPIQRESASGNRIVATGVSMGVNRRCRDDKEAE